MNRIGAFLVSGLFLLVLFGLFTAVAQSKWKAPVVSHRSKPILKKLERLQAENPNGSAQAVTGETTFDFGVLNPNSTNSRPFTIRNNGPLPLTLKPGPTSCKCTVADLQDKTLFPGRETEVRLEWNTGRSDAHFRQSATILTNDPDRPEVVFEIQGQVRLTCYAEPAAVLFPDILPGSTTTTQTLVCSQKWHNFTIANIESSLAGLTWNVEPLGEDEALALEVKSGYRLVLTSPPELADARFSGLLKVTAFGPDERDAPETVEISLAGKLRNRVALYGSQIDEKGVVELGLLSSGQGAKIPLMLRVRDAETDLVLREVRARPDFVQVKLRPHSDATGTIKPGLYHLDIEVPKDAPQCNHLGVNIGQVVVEFDHPRVNSVKVKLSFAVLENSE